MATRSTPAWARFDDLSAATATRFTRFAQEVLARTPDEVADALRAVDALTRAGRWACGFVAYEAAGGLDPTLVTHAPVDGLPLVWFGIADGPRQVPVLDERDAPAVPGRPWTVEWDAAAHERAVVTVRDRIAAGDTYQCNLTTRLRAPLREEPYDLYRALALGQRGAYNAYLDLGRFVVASASPELFFTTSGERILMRPMKGTAPRGRTTAEDATAVARLRASPKERAENIMIVDLVRNDIARVAATGSVTVPRLLWAERYETVHQLTSDVAATLSPDADLTAVFRALFPCGSVTGAPKAATMQLIREVEPGPRGVYCGAIGVVGPGTARFSVAIRTVLADRERGTLTYGAGGGVTWSSQPAAEYAELLSKARVLDVRPTDFHLLETMRHDGELGTRNLDAHLARAADSAHYFGFRFDAERVRGVLADRLDGVGAARVRLRCYRGGDVGVDVTDPPTPAVGPVRLALDPDPLDSRQCWPHHKTSLRAPYTTRLTRHPDADDVVLSNERGEITETCVANLAVGRDGTWWTPPLGSGCLPGVERARLVASGCLREAPLTPADLAAADAIALISSLRGWRRAVLEEG